MSDDDDDLLELLARDLDGDLTVQDRLALYARLADHPRPQGLLRRAADLKRASDTLATASNATPAPDMADFIIDRVAAEAAAQAPTPKRRGLMETLKAQFAGRRKDDDAGRAGPGARTLSGADLAGVVAGTGAEGDDGADAADAAAADPASGTEEAGAPADPRDGEEGHPGGDGR